MTIDDEEKEILRIQLLKKVRGDLCRILDQWISATGNSNIDYDYFSRELAQMTLRIERCKELS